MGSGMALQLQYQRYCTSINYVEKCRALSVLEMREICCKREHAKEKLSDFGKNFIDDGVVIT